MVDFSKGRTIEDFYVGERFQTATFTLDEEALLSFSQMYDPQPLHTNKEYAKEGPFGELIASGIQTLAISIRLFIEMGFFNGTCLSGPAIDDILFSQPVKVGDTIRCQVTVIEARNSRKSNNKGILRTSYRVFNQNSVVVLSHKVTTIMSTKPIINEEIDNSG
tara:strand:+ start:2316 stop:2804 length:489 start_codon:yes stop_codon:yes gene_type:complete